VFLAGGGALHPLAVSVLPANRQVLRAEERRIRMTMAFE